MQPALIAAIVALYTVPFLITMLKGKFWLGLISMGIGGMFLTVPGATRLAKPDSGGHCGSTTPTSSPAHSGASTATRRRFP